MSNYNQHEESLILQPIKGHCAYCNGIAVRMCTGCLNSHYCNREHQTFDWPNHARDCRILKLVKDPWGENQCYVAMRDIKFGELVYEEKEPLVMGPSIDESADFSHCLKCYVDLTMKNSKPCEKCGWPLCTNCNTHGSECDFTINYMKRKVSIENFEETDNIYKFILLIRSLQLKSTNMNAYDKLLKLQDAKIKGKEKLLKEAHRKSLKMIHKDWVKMIPYVNDTLLMEMEIIQTILMIFNHNIIINNRCLVAVYENVSYFTHDCMSNCTMTNDDTGAISIRAVRDIYKGEILTICKVNPILHAMRRRFHLAEKYIDCRCDRCCDPEEFGTMYNAVKCTKSDCDGYMLPLTFILTGLRKLPDFVCDECNAVTPWITIRDILSKYDMRIEIILKNNKNNTVTLLRKHLEELKKIFHKNHGTIVFAKLQLAINIGSRQILRCLSDDLLDEKQKYSVQTVLTLQKIAPSSAPIRGMLLYNMYTCHNEYSRRRRKAPRPIKKSLELLINIYKLLRFDSTDPDYKSLANYVKEAYDELKFLVEPEDRTSLN